ncbi:MAG: hypothetical protein LBH97_00990 [Treponema sp.]|jgi:two-component system chemotaxis sensor kinase CheA|nr:hypothetical protein [Treponema sp.]
MSKKKNKIKDIDSYKVANRSVVAAVLFLGGISLFEALKVGGAPQIPVVLCMVVAIAIMLPFLKSTTSPAVLAFFTPIGLFIYYTQLTVLGGWNTPFYLLVCLCFCGISCLYSSFRMTLWSVVVLNIVIGMQIYRGVPIMGNGVPLFNVLISWVVTLFGMVIFLLLSRFGNVTLVRALEDRDSFRTLLATTTSYITMVDKSNKVTYASKPLAHLAQIDRPELAQGRSFIDLFPGRELKFLAYQLLSQKDSYEDSWEFTLHGEKRYFKVTSIGLAGTSGSTLISLHDLTHLAERDEIALMKDSLEIGLLFIDREYLIQANYSRYLEELMSGTELAGKNLIELLSASHTAKELDAIRDYFEMIFERSLDQSMLDDINPLDECHYVSIETGNRKIFHFKFTSIERARGEVFVLVTIYDITARIELKKRLAEEENKRQEEMRSIFELIQVEHGVFGDFLDDAEYEFGRIKETLKNDTLSAHEVLVNVYQSVHAIKSNAVILGLNTFGNKVHNLESKIKKLREMGDDVPFDSMLELAMELERLAQEKDNFRTTLDKIQSFKTDRDDGHTQGEHILVDSLTKTVNKVAEDMEKKIKFTVEGIEPEAIDKGPRRVMKEVLVQLIRNSAVHGIEMPAERVAAGKNETGNVRLLIKMEDGKILVRLGDDGGGINYKKIAQKALQQKMIKKEDAVNKGALLKAMFAPGFSTAETEGMHAGRGVGLNLVQERVREAKGTIKVQSEAGKGTVFSFYFPAGQ